MYIKPEDRPIGKENFETAIAVGKGPKDGVSRRDFLIGTVAAGAVSGAGLGAMYFGYDKSMENPVRIGFIGTGDEGSVLIGAHTPSYVQCVAIADIRPYNIHRAFHGDYSSDNAFQARPGLMAKYGWSSEEEARKQVKVYENYKDLLKAVENKELDLEGVVISLPLHLHAEAAILAMKAGLHVLTEKLMARTVAQCKEMGRVAKQTGKYLATGHQRHYSILYDNAIHTIKNGLLGDLHHIRAQWHRAKDTWQPPLPGDEALVKQMASVKRRITDAEKAKKPAEVEKWRRFLVQIQKQVEDKAVDAAFYGYQEKRLPGGYHVSPIEELIRWRLWERTGGGLMAELGSHQLDAAGIFCTAARNDGEKALPLTVQATGGRHLYEEDRECEDHVYCMYEYPGPKYEEDNNKKIVVTYSSINGSPFGDYGECVMGTDRTLVLLKEQEAMIFDNAGPATKIDVSKADTLDTTASGGGAAIGKAAMEAGPISRGYTEEMEHWAWCIRNPSAENQPRCHPKVALADAVIALTTNIAIRNPEHSRIEFKKEWFDIDSDETPELAYLEDAKYKVTLDRAEYKPKA
ncbi:MAG: Gfo/Idh/MocA family oxidoreductase [Pirellulales bacterium]